MRELARSIARERMRAFGYKRINKRRPGRKSSLFAEHWREFVYYPKGGHV